MSSTNLATQHSRRTMIRGAAWAAPTVTIATAAPALAASSSCVELSLPLEAPGNNATFNPLVLPATGEGAGDNVYEVRISSVLGPNTTTSQNGQDFNLSRNSTGWAGGTQDRVASGFGPLGSIVLNQRATVDSNSTTDLQTLTFTFMRNGVAFDPVDVSITMFDISSATSTYWRSTYYETVGFSVTPTSIGPSASVQPGTDAGIGAGTFANPFRRSTATLPTGSPPNGGLYSDVFSFDTLPSGSQMQFGQVAGFQGWHYVTISGIRFSSPECA